MPQHTLLLAVGFLLFIAMAGIAEFLLRKKHVNVLAEFRRDFEPFRETYISENLAAKLTPILNQYSQTYKFYTNRESLAKERDDISDFLVCYSFLARDKALINADFIKDELEICDEMFSDIDGHPLDPQQKEAVVTDELNTRVVAGAGCGKTSTIVGKVKYLIERKKIAPNEILLLSFSNNTVEEMTSRIRKVNDDLKASTFHKLGWDIVREHEDEKRAVTKDNDLSHTIKDFFQKAFETNSAVAGKILTYFAFHMAINRDVSEFDSLGEYYNYLKNVDLETLKTKYSVRTVDERIRAKQKERISAKEKVRSIQEAMIANFLFLHGINYEYEAPYPYENNYKPDFYLPDFDVYIEHFGITKDEKVPWLSAPDEKKYLDGIEWKRKTHKINHTTLLETYSYYRDTLFEQLDSELVSAGVTYQSVDYDKIYRTVFANSKDTTLTEFRELLSKFICQCKTRGYSTANFPALKHKEIEESEFMRNRRIAFLDIAEEAYRHYEQFLRDNNKLDFDDMIIDAAKLVRTHGCKQRYKYILVDEFQDISASRFELLKAIRDATNAKTFCVGDDWQSIYAFSGSDVEFFYSFPQYLGKTPGETATVKIEKTYRNSQELVDIAGKFVMQNPRQLKKHLISDRHEPQPITLIKYPEAYRDKPIDKGQALCDALDMIAQQYGEDTSVLLLGRYNDDIKDFTSVTSVDVYGNSKAKERKVVYQKYRQMKIRFMTVHSAKGLEDDNVIILNARSGRYGFPCLLQDDPILDLLRDNPEDFENAEERRLFYVALTRTKNEVILLVPELSPSIFVKNLERIDAQQESKSVKSKITNGEKSHLSSLPCPKCKTGKLITRHNHSDFLGCSNYPYCDYTASDVGILENPIVCKECGYYMRRVLSTDEPFLGCTNYDSTSRTGCRATLPYSSWDSERQAIQY